MKKRRVAIHPFVAAMSGIVRAVRTEPHMPIHLMASVLVTAAGFYFSISKMEWLVLLITIALVIGAELINTAIEYAVDLATEEIHPLAKAAKDIAAGAVLVTAVFAVIIGVIIFYSPVLKWMETLF